ncbi:hypothetical protein BRO54_0865 [Geobacillus proteiniphilus]|uniref:Uncharacterized protein n=1 Tax=Geobacillus proteiniphilus TaxID=860353 RepID=A0A1Q5T5D3_9BACL|nr:hypothetical protein BRO54_0865 [Geobacillus proteiniphilus]
MLEPGSFCVLGQHQANPLDGGLHRIGGDFPVGDKADDAVIKRAGQDFGFF